MLSAHSTARERGDAQIVGRRPEPERIRTLRFVAREYLDLLLPAALTLLGDSSHPCNMSTCSPEMAATISSCLRRVLKLNVKRKGVSMKDGRLEQHQEGTASLRPQCSWK